MSTVTLSHMAHSLAVLSHDHEKYAALLRPQLPPCVDLLQHGSDPADIATDDVTILLGEPDLLVQTIAHCDKLMWCQSAWAGNRPLLSLTKQNYILTSAKGIYAAQMREYVFAYLLYFARNIGGFTATESNHQTAWQSPEFSYLSGTTLGILGAGNIAQSLVPVAQSFGMKVIGVNTSGQTVSGFNAMYTLDEIEQFASQCNALVNLLPDTPATENIISHNVLNAMKQNSLLINAGRGVAIDDDALLQSLNNNHLKGAVLDVFRQEPLPEAHPFWQHPKIIVTHHTAALSKTEDVANLFIQNLERFLANQQMQHVCDFARGY